MQGYGGGGGRGMPEPDTVLDLSDAMRKNPHLKVFSANGMFDLATPFFGTEHDLGQLMLPETLTHNVQFGYYPAGHMVYLNVEALKEMHADLDKFYGEASHR
jgi:carboxypeptidase C (cathepsin A)